MLFLSFLGAVPVSYMTSYRVELVTDLRAVSRKVGELRAAQPEASTLEEKLLVWTSID